MAMTMAIAIEPDIAPAMASETTASISPTTEAAAAGARQRSMGLLRRMMRMPRAGRHYTPVGVEQEGTAPAGSVPLPPAPDANAEEKPRPGWMLRLVVPRDQCAQQRRRPSGRWKDLSDGASRLARSLRWKRLSSGLSVSLRGSGWATAMLDTVAFRVMYVVEAVVLGLGLSCFFCCCGCQI